MSIELSRRAFTFLAVPASGLGALALVGAAHGQTEAPKVPVTPGTLGPPGTPDPLALFPRQPLALAEKVVGLSHRDLKGVQELVEAQPALANAAHDWGFGDWETALGAASHTGRVEIAEYLISKGARPDLFAFAMLGNLAAVKAAVEAVPGVQRIRGPHGISLLKHAQAGDDRAKPVADYLESLGDADPAYTNLPVTPELKRQLMGTYAWGMDESERLEVGEGMGGLTIKRTGKSAIRLFQQSPTAFHPPAGPSITINFVIITDSAASVTIADHDHVVNAERVK